MFLAKFGIMDYSLLFGIAERNIVRQAESEEYFEKGYARIIFSEDNNYLYFLNIIDFLQEYNLSKRIEHSLKRIKLSSSKAKNISAIPPKLYSSRFCHFIFTKLLNMK